MDQVGDMANATLSNFEKAETNNMSLFCDVGLLCLKARTEEKF